MPYTRSANYVLYQLGWFAAVLGAAWGWPMAGAALAITLAAAHVWLAPDRSREVVLVGVTLAIGAAVETWQMAAGTYASMAGAPPGVIPPAWLLALWAQFATTLRHSLWRVIERPLIAALFGALGGPVAFLAGERLGAVTLTRPLGPGLVRLAAAWAAALVVLSVTTRRLPWSADRSFIDQGPQSEARRDQGDVGVASRDPAPPGGAGPSGISRRQP